MTLRNSFRRLPPFRFSTRARVDQLVCDPRSYVRAWQADGRPLWAPCLAWSPGPQILATTGDGSFTTLYGSNWLAQVCQDGSWRLYQRTSDEALTVVAWDVEPPTVSISARHPSLAFDQAAKPAIAWEDESGIWLREFNEVSGAYGFVGPFAGVDPVLICDATVNYHVAGSDVVLFYLSEDRLTLNYRIQSENFGTEHAHHTFPSAAVLDAQDIGGYRFQLRYSDSEGAVIGPVGDGFTALLSDVYPIYVSEELSVSVGALEDGVYTLVVITRPEVTESVSATVGALADGVLLNVILQRAEVIDALDATVGSLGDGVLFYAIIPRSEVVESVDAAVGSLADGVLFYVLINRSEVVDALTASVGSLEDGVYAAA